MVRQLLSNLGVWHWFALALILIIFEIILNSGFLLWIAIASGIVGLVVALFADITWLSQLLIFGIIASLTCIIGQVYFRKASRPVAGYRLNRRGEQYIGRSFILSEAIVNGVGHIQVDDTLWKVKGPDRASGERVKVVGMEGVILIVVAD